jgi:hypothetical protein
MSQKPSRDGKSAWRLRHADWFIKQSLQFLCLKTFSLEFSDLELAVFSFHDGAIDSCSCMLYIR